MILGVVVAEREGVIKYRLHHRYDAFAYDASRLTALNSARDKLVRAGMLGCDPARYEGLGFGNLSERSLEGFVISGTQTGAIDRLDLKDLVLVTRSRAETNELWSKGDTKPSSESMTHGVIYDRCPKVEAVVHVHCPDIWYHGDTLNLASTHMSLAYGSPEMARAVADLVSNTDNGIFTMRGHQDGVVAYGEGLSECVEHLLSLKSRIEIS